jgi:hypothetical protein
VIVREIIACLDTYPVSGIEKDLEKDVDDCSVAEKADKEEDPVGETSHVSDHGMLQKSAKNIITRSKY